MNIEEENLSMLATRTRRGMSSGDVKNPDVALSTLCVLPFLERIATDLTRIADTLDRRDV